MERIARLDLFRSFRTKASRLLAQLLFGIACGLIMIASRSLIDQFAPNVGPFALVYPTILLATLYGHWQAGAAATAVSFFWAWWYVLPIARSIEIGTQGDGWRVVINGMSALIVLAFAEVFRRAVKETTEQRDREIEQRNTLLADLEHRTKNSFQLIQSLLEVQKRRETEPSAKVALELAIGRVRSFSAAYSKMPIPSSEGDYVALRSYLEQIVNQVAEAVFDIKVTVTTSIDDLSLPRQQAVALGLYTNEALTNCAKHAFPNGRAGIVKVGLSAQPNGWDLVIEDSGVGLERSNPPTPGTGSSLMDAFAAQACGKHTITTSASGFSVRLRSAQVVAEDPLATA